MIRMRIGFESAYEDSEVRDEALRAYLHLGAWRVEFTQTPKKVAFVGREMGPRKFLRKIQVGEILSYLANG